MEALIKEQLNAMSTPVQLETVARFSPIRLIQKVFWCVEMLSCGSDSSQDSPRLSPRVASTVEVKPK